jgi:hypothetical protein
MMKTNHTTITVLVVLAAISATLLAAGTVTVASNHSAFAWKEKGYKKDKYQRDDNKYQNDGSERGGNSITAIASNEQSSECETAGSNSPISNSCNQAATAAATNNGETPPPIPPGQPCAGFVFDVHLREASGNFPKGTEICLFKPGENSPTASPPGATIIPPSGTPLTGQTVRIDHAVGGNCPGGTHVDVDTGNPPDGFSLGEIACVTIST